MIREKDTVRRDKAIQEVLNNFNFERTAEIMRLLDRQWPRLGRTPNAKELREKGAELLKRAWKHGYSSSGGLAAEKTKESLALRFEAIDSELFLP